MNVQTRSYGILFIILASIVLILYYVHNSINATRELFTTGKEQRIVISLTTSPKRMALMKETLESLINQSIKPDKIYINIPYIFKRTQEKYDLTKLQPRDHPLVQINRCDDYGPITKLLPTIVTERNLGSPENTLILTLDDDHGYGAGYIENVLHAAKRYPNAALSLHCTDIYTKPKHNRDTMFEGIKKANAHRLCDIAEAFSGVSYRLSFFDYEFEEYVRIALLDDACFRSDDFVLSNYLERKKIPRVKISNKKFSFPKDVTIFSYGYQQDALHFKDNMSKRYGRCSQYITNKGYTNGLVPKSR